ncbi:aspartic peptidase A1 [Mycena crocata]|nr:aspartic peptidase A1 [Mycena crocata]
MGTAALHKMHVNRGVRRLAAMSGARWSSLAKTHGHPSRPSAPPAIGTRSQRRHATMVERTTGGLPERILDPGGGTVKMPDETKTNGTAHSDVGLQAKPESEHESDAEVTKAHNTTFLHSAPLDIEANDIGYLATILLGTPARPFRMLVDSGSADMWVGGEQCMSDDGSGDCGDHRFLGETGSSTFNDTGKPWGIGYGTGSVSGNLATDDVVFAGLTLKNHTFGIARNESAEFTPNEIPLDGVLGCAKQSLSIQQTPTLVKALQIAGLIARNVISYKISRYSDGKNDGEITLGGMDPSKYDHPSLVRVKNVNTKGFWEAPLDTIKVNRKSVGLVGRSCIFDTGTTLFIAPKEDVDVIHKAIPGAVFNSTLNTWTVPCTTNTSVSLGFGGKSFPIDPTDLAFLAVNPQDPTGACTSSIAVGGVSDGLTHWLVGDTFLKNTYFSTDEDNNEMSIARLARVAAI